MTKARPWSVATTLAATLLLPAAAAAQSKEVVVGNISAMTGPTSGTHMMCQSGSRDLLNYLNGRTGR
jgi:hypothetical protein